MRDQQMIGEDEGDEERFAKGMWTIETKHQAVFHVKLVESAAGNIRQWNCQKFSNLKLQ